MRQDDLLSASESQSVEFKTSFNQEVMVSLVALSNASGRSVYVGVVKIFDNKIEFYNPGRLPESAFTHISDGFQVTVFLPETQSREKTVEKNSIYRAHWPQQRRLLESINPQTRYPCLLNPE
jgi:hypothetical protein